MQKTKDYEQFKLLDLNRNLNRKHINELKDSISKNGYLVSNPIIVNENMEIIDGQHRFVALKEQGMEVPYEIITDKDYSTIIDLNTTQRKWNIEDYINYYCEKDKNPHFLRLRRVCKELNLSVTTILTMVFGCMPDGNYYKNMKKGIFTFTIDDELKVSRIAENFLVIAKSLRLKPSCRFCSALVGLSALTGFRWKIMIDKATKFSTLAYSCRTEGEYKAMLRDIYNYNQKKEDNKI